MEFKNECSNFEIESLNGEDKFDLRQAKTSHSQQSAFNIEEGEHSKLYVIECEDGNSSYNLRSNEKNSYHDNSNDRKRLEINNKWEGIIEEISNNIVYARMYDFETDSEDFIEFDILDFDQAFIKEKAEVGDRFFLYVGYDYNKQKKHIGLINIRKYYLVDDMSENEINGILDNINRLKSAINS